MEALPPHQGTIFPGSNSVRARSTVLGSGMGRVFPCLPAACLAQASQRRSKHTASEKPSPTEFTEETKKPRRALADGDVPLQTTAPVATLAALRELCKRGGDGSFSGPLLLVGLGQPCSLAGCHPRGELRWTAATRPPRHSLLQRDGPTVQSRSPARALRGCCSSLLGA